MRREFDHIKKSRGYFKEGLSLLGRSKKSFPEIESALRQNLELTVGLAGKAKNQNGEEPGKAIALHLKWQYKYIEFLVADNSQGLPLLLEAEELLSVLPYGVTGDDPSTLAMVEDLYLALTRLLLDEKRFAEALMFSEKGRQQLLVALRPELELIDEDRRSYYDEFSSYADRFLLAVKLESQGKGEGWRPRRVSAASCARRWRSSAS